MAKLYPGIAFSPQTTLAENIGAADTIIRVADASVFPPAPNYATIGTDEDGETIEYAAKADGLLSGCTRGVEGTAKAWQKGEVIARNFTAADHNGMITAVTAAQSTATTAQQTAEAAQQTADNCLPLSGGVMEGDVILQYKGYATATIKMKNPNDSNRVVIYKGKNPGEINLFGVEENFTANETNRLVQLGGINAPIYDSDAANKLYVDSHIINPNLLDNAYFGNPVNQRWQTEYTGNAYTIDRWYIYAGRLDIVRDSHITITRNNMTDYFDLRQYIEGLDKDLVYTFSILSDGKLYSITGTFTSNPVTKTPFGEIMLSWSGGEANIVVIRPLTTDPVNITAAKLELGPIQTLAHQENGVWVLNEIPNYALELAKCQRYFQKTIAVSISGFIYFGTTFVGLIPGVQMRITPSIRTISKQYIFHTSGRYDGDFLINSLRIDSCGTMIKATTPTEVLHVGLGCLSDISIELSADL